MLRRALCHHIDGARSDGLRSPPTPAVWCAERQDPQSAGVLFLWDSAPPLDREEGAVETAALLRRVHYAKFWRSRRRGYEFSALQQRSTLLVAGKSFDHPLFDRHARNFRQKLAHAQIPHLRLKFELHYGGAR